MNKRFSYPLASLIILGLAAALAYTVMHVVSPDTEKDSASTMRAADTNAKTNAETNGIRSESIQSPYSSTAINASVKATAQATATVDTSESAAIDQDPEYSPTELTPDGRYRLVDVVNVDDELIAVITAKTASYAAEQDDSVQDQDNTNTAFKFYSEGDMLNSAWSVTLIFDTKVMLDNAAGDEYWLYEDTNGESISEGFYEELLKNSNFTRFADDFPDMAEHITFDSEIEPNKVLASYRMMADMGYYPVNDFDASGYRIKHHDSNRQLVEVGLQDGDILLRINEYALGKPAYDLEYISTEIQHAQTNQQDIVLHIIRDSVEQTLVIDFRQAQLLY